MAWRINPDAVWEVEDGKVYVTLAHSPEILTLDEVGSHIWCHLESQTIRDIAASFDDGDQAEIEAGIERYLEDLAMRGLVEKLNRS